MWLKDPETKLAEREAEIERLREQIKEVKSTRRRKLPSPLRRVLVGLIIWETIWKGAALWKAARRGDLRWFIAILFSNTVGALPIYYLTRVEEAAEETDA